MDALAAQLCIEKQQASLKEKGGKMLRRSLRLLDELEAVEALEAAAAASRSSAVAPAPLIPTSFVPNDSSSSANPLDWELLDFGGRTSLQSALQT